MALVDEQYMLLTTFRKSGAPVATPVWLTDIGNGEVGFYTSSESGKAKRLRHTARVTVQLCNARGQPAPGSEPLETTARLVTGAEYEELRRRVVAKYGLITKVIRTVISALGVVRRKPVPYGDIGVAVVVPEALR